MGLVEFTDLVYEHGAAYLKQATVRAVSTCHRLEVAVSFLRMMAPMDQTQRSVVEPQRALRLMQIYPELQDQIELEVDESEPGKMYVDAAGREALRKLIRQLLERQRERMQRMLLMRRLPTGTNRTCQERLGDTGRKHLYCAESRI